MALSFGKEFVLMSPSVFTVREVSTAGKSMTPEAQIRFVQTGSHRLAYTGQNENAEGIPVVFIHGLTASLRFWDAAMYQHLREQHPWYSLSLPFHYPSTFTAGARLDEFMLAEMMDKCLHEMVSGQKIILVGYSLGGFAALNYAAKYPARVHSVISIGGFMSGGAKGLEKVLMGLSKGRLIRKAIFHLGWRLMCLHPFFLKMAVLLYAADQRALLRYKYLDETIRNIFPDVRRHPVEKIRQLFRYLIDMNVLDEIAKIKMPVLVIAGEADPIIPYEHQRRCAEVLPNSQFLSLPGAGHVALGERPDVVEGAIVDWVKAAQVSLHDQ